MLNPFGGNSDLRTTLACARSPTHLQGADFDIMGNRPKQ